MKTLHAVTLRNRRPWVSALAAVMIVVLVASFVAWPAPEAVQESSLLPAWLDAIADRWLPLLIWAGLALAAFAAPVLRSGGVIGSLAGEAREGAVDFWTPALPWRNERRTFSVDSSQPLRVSVVERTDMAARYPHVLLEWGEAGYTAKLDGKARMFTASGILELARHAGVTVEVDETAAEIVRDDA
ncbi:MAG: hypothetical protein DIU73_005145 [Actinomycetes bacterium]|nr:MAG: hypothetical protein DIU73_02485 [Actinomycetota bacterium]